MLVRTAPALVALVLAGCTVTKTVYVEDTSSEGTSPEPTGGTDPTADDDGDGLTNADETDLGTDPTLADSDGDGFSDGEEVDAGTHPLNEYSRSYEGGYNVGNCGASDLPASAGPSGMSGYGFAIYNVGDKVANFTLEDQYGEQVDMYSFCGQTVMLTFSAMWCGPCQDAASRMQAEQEEFGAEGFQAIEILIEDFNYGSGMIVGDDLEYWADWFGLQTVPVLADPAGSAEAEWYHWEMDFGIPSFMVIGPDMTVEAVDTYNTDPAAWL